MTEDRLEELDALFDDIKVYTNNTKFALKLNNHAPNWEDYFMDYPFYKVQITYKEVFEEFGLEL